MPILLLFRVRYFRKYLAGSLQNNIIACDLMPVEFCRQLPLGQEKMDLNNSRGVALVVLGVLVLSSITAGWMLSVRSLDNHECFVSVAAREMLASGNWVMPTFNGQLRLQKTPLSYWLVAGVAKATGKVDEFAARLPSAAFAVFSVCAILYFVRQWLSLRVAIICAGVWLTSFGYIRYSHNARPEMALTFFVTLCFLSFYSAITACSRKNQIVYMLVFWVSFGLGNLAKGPAPIPLVLVPLFVYMAITRQWRLTGKLLPVCGVLIFLAIMLPWPLAAAYKVNWDLVLWKHEFVDRFFGEYAKGRYPVYFYFLIMFKYAAPWIYFLLTAFASPFFKVWGEKRNVMKFVWLWFVADFVFLTISGGKRQHYLLPQMPAIAILAGIILEDMIFTRKAFSARQARWVLGIHIAVAVLFGAGLIGYGICRMREYLPAFLATGCVIIVGAAVIGVLFARGRPGIGCAGIFIWLVTIMMIVFAWIIKPLNSDEPSRRFAATVARMAPATDKLFAYNHAPGKFIYYVGRVIPEIRAESEAESFCQQGCWIAAFGESLDELRKTGRYELVYMEPNADEGDDKPVAGGLFHIQKPVGGAAE
jgi:4-amino-4-deoxy-L-arabinose transferase-like glycosyltransferase